MNRLLFILFLSPFLFACSNGEPVPENVMPPKKMEAVLWDAILADETADYYVQKDSSVNVLAKHVDMYQQLFQIHKITKEDFKRSLRFYEKHPLLLRPIFDSLQKKSERLIRNTKPVSVS
jgi:hypothetical protein